MAKPLAITWQDSLEDVRCELELQLISAGPFKRNKLIAARALLDLLKRGERPTADEVINFVIARDFPGDKSKYLDRAKWTNYLPEIVQQLTSANPMSVFS